MAKLCYSNYALPVGRYGIMVNKGGDVMVTARKGRVNEVLQSCKATSSP